MPIGCKCLAVLLKGFNQACMEIHIKEMGLFDFLFLSYYLHKNLNVKRHIPFLTPYNKHKIHININ